jgi:hypothetical protein
MNPLSQIFRPDTDADYTELPTPIALAYTSCGCGVYIRHPRSNIGLGVVQTPDTASEKREGTKTRRHTQTSVATRYSILFLLRVFVPSRLRVKFAAVPEEAFHPLDS